MKLKFPNEKDKLYTYFEYSMDKELGGFSAKGSFCRTFMQVMDETAEAVGISREYKPTLTDYCEHMDDVYNERKALVNRRMVEFLKENNGVIDRWPEPESYTYVVFDGDAGENKFYFNYAGSAYKVTDGGVRRSSEEPQPAPHGACPYEPDPAVENVARARALRAAELRKLDEEKANNSWRGLRAAIALLPAALGVIFAAVCLAGFFLQMNPIAMGQALLTAAQGSEGLSKAAGVLDMLLRFPGLIYEFTGFGTWAFFIALLVTEGVFALVSRILWKMFMPEKIDDGAYAKAADAYNALNAQYKNMAVEYQTARKEWLEISKQWNEEYHRVLKAKGVKIKT